LLIGVDSGFVSFGDDFGSSGKKVSGFSFAENENREGQSCGRSFGRASFISSDGGVEGVNVESDARREGDVDDFKG